MDSDTRIFVDYREMFQIFSYLKNALSLFEYILRFNHLLMGFIKGLFGIDILRVVKLLMSIIDSIRNCLEIYGEEYPELFENVVLEVKEICKYFLGEKENIHLGYHR